MLISEANPAYDFPSSIPYKLSYPQFGPVNLSYVIPPHRGFQSAVIKDVKLFPYPDPFWTLFFLPGMSCHSLLLSSSLQMKMHVSI